MTVKCRPERTGKTAPKTVRALLRSVALFAAMAAAMTPASAEYRAPYAPPPDWDHQDASRLYRENQEWRERMIERFRQAVPPRDYHNDDDE